MDFQAFGEKTFPKPKPIDTPPFYAAQFFPLTRKSMGGIDVDIECRVLDHIEARRFRGCSPSERSPASVESTERPRSRARFLGPGIYMGRIAGRSIAQELGPRPAARAEFRSRP